MANHKLPNDIETDILLRLPVKSLKRFQCVSKPWNSLISSPQFQKAHFRRAHQNPPLLLTVRHEKGNSYYSDSPTICLSTYSKEGTLVNRFSATFPQQYDGASIIGKPLMQSCQGFVLLTSWGCPSMLVCNPSTQDVISLPHNKEITLCSGFGFAPSTQQFKVVRFFNAYDSGAPYRCEVFTLGTSHWREATQPPYSVYPDNIPFIHGALHFLPSQSYSHVQPTDYIAAFDVDTEEYNNEIRLPDYYYTLEGHPDIAKRSTFKHLNKLGGSLCLTLDFGKLAGRLEMWLLKDYHNVQWARGHTIDISPVCDYRSNSYLTYPVEEMVDMNVLVHVSYVGGIRLLENNPQEEVVTLEIDQELSVTFYVESLYPLLGQENWNFLEGDCGCRS